ncbi:MAG: hypothetical protein OEW68_09780 [Gammaproteobacteria bacterium]|nr:hypothetical protein [Gammaproteobacteria bacterium]MDH4315116.1 hypothetical protein [Gammaproteobacteria bacterium]MDH5214261.1 hypothetical protein [Gammaproteobacteria bacterium]MDH5500641.1 hypothetical protein [Gammaproteobacteria bacterium]
MRASSGQESGSDEIIRLLDCATVNQITTAGFSQVVETALLLGYSMWLALL